MAHPPVSAVSTSAHQQPPCPPWCTSDHARKDPPQRFQNHYTADIGIMPESKSVLYLSTRALASGDCAWQRVVVNGSAPAQKQASRSPMAFIDPGEAIELAGIIDLLADTTPDEHHRLAEGIRRSAALIKDAPSGQT